MNEAKALTPRQLDQQRRVLESTRQMLAERGYDGVQMRTLAERAGVSLMTLYNRFGNKDDLIQMALREVLQELAERARVSGKRGIELVAYNAQVTGEQIVATPEYAKAMALMLFNGGAETPIVDALLANSLDQAVEQIEDMRVLGEITDEVDAALLARGLSVAGWSSILLWMKGLIPDEEFLDHYRRAPILVLASAMTAKTKRRYSLRRAR